MAYVSISGVEAGPVVKAVYCHGDLYRYRLDVAQEVQDGLGIGSLHGGVKQLENRVPGDVRRASSAAGHAQLLKAFVLFLRKTKAEQA